MEMKFAVQCNAVEKLLSRNICPAGYWLPLAIVFYVYRPPPYSTPVPVEFIAYWGIH